MYLLLAAWGRGDGGGAGGRSSGPSSPSEWADRVQQHRGRLFSGRKAQSGAPACSSTGQEGRAGAPSEWADGRVERQGKQKPTLLCLHSAARGRGDGGGAGGEGQGPLSGPSAPSEWPDRG